MVLTMYLFSRKLSFFNIFSEAVVTKTVVLELLLEADSAVSFREVLIFQVR